MPLPRLVAVALAFVFAPLLRASDTVYLFTYFTGKGADGLHLAWSEDGYYWTALGGGRSFLAPQVGRDRLMRDPSVVRGPDGTYHLVWTTGWWDNHVGYASTKDFLTWSEQESIPVMAHEPNVRNSWAPEVAWDPRRERFIVFWASTIPEKFSETAGASEDGLNHRMYFTTTKDWKAFAPTQLLADPGFSVIDATLLPTEGAPHFLIIKDETRNPPKKHLRLARADDVEGPWREFAPPFTRDWVEGPTAIRVGDDAVVYFDVYRERHYGAVRAKGFYATANPQPQEIVWEDITDQISIPAGARHGTMIPVSRAIVQRLIAAETNASTRMAASPPGTESIAGDPKPAPDLATNPAAATVPLDPSLPTVFIAGDSTAAKNNADPVQGWGVPFANYFDPAKINVANRARGGRSSRTFITEGLWDQLLAEVKPGDFVLIQFGHNDGGAINEEPPGSTRPLRARGSLPGIGEESQEIDNVLTKKHEAVRTFGWYLRKMVADVRAKGATPILLSPTVRNNWKDGKVERGAAHRGWTRAVALAEGVAFVDVTRLVADGYQSLGEAKVAALFGGDHTHTNVAGADFNAAAVVAGLKGLRDAPWETFLSEKGRAVEADRIGWLNLPEPAKPELPSVVLIGDSTVRNGRGDGAGGEWGWGDPIAELFDLSRINVVNRAIGGLSSRTFLTQGHWERALTLLKPGDFLIVQFGHNDAGPLNDTSRARGTIKGVGEETEEIDNLLTNQREVVHTYGWYLRRYVREAKERGVTPILCSPVPRKKWENGRIARATGSYAHWAREVAEQEGVAFIDLNELVARQYEQLGPQKVDALFADAHTHTSRLGAELNAAIVAEAIRELPDVMLREFLLAK